MLEEAQRCGDVYAVWRDGIGRRVTQQGPHRARPHIVAKEMLRSETHDAEARTSRSLASFDHALRPDDTAFVHWQTGGIGADRDFVNKPDKHEIHFSSHQF